nr:transporter substrate-binding domain-containing protein [Kineosporia babensis]
MRATVAAVSAAALVLTACGDERESLFDGQNAISIGYVVDSPGFSWGEEDPQGLDASLATALYASLKSPDMPSDEQTKVRLNNVGERDAAILDRKTTLVAAAYSITPARNQKGIDFAGPYLKTGQAFLVPKGSSATPADLQGRSVCVVSGTTAPADSSGLSDLTTRDKVSQCIELLNDGAVEAVFDDTLVLYGYMGLPDYKNDYRIIEDVKGRTQYYGIGILGGHQEDCERVNEAIKKYLAGNWKSDFASYFPAIPPSVYQPNNPFLPNASEMSERSCQVEADVTASDG